MSEFKAVILVGGAGTRLRPLTNNTPKPMVPVLNRPFLEHTLAYLKQSGIADVVLALNYLPGVIKDYFNGGAAGLNLIYIVEKDPLGTAGAVKNAEGYLNSTCAVLNGDIFTNLRLDEMLHYHRAKQALVTISLIQVDNPSAFGVVETDNDGRVKRFIEKPPPGEATTNWINAGIYIVEPEALDYVPQGTHYMFEKGLFPHLLETGKPVYGYPFKGYWLDMGTPEKYLSLNCDLLLSRVKSPLDCQPDSGGISIGKEVLIHPSARISPPVIVGENCRIAEGVELMGPVVTGPNCLIEEGSRLENTILWNDVRIGGRVNLDRCIVGSDTGVQPGSRATDSLFYLSQTLNISG